MTKTVTCQVRIARPDAKELKLLWKLFHAAEKVEDRWCDITIRPIYEELKNTELSNDEKRFILRAWQVLVDGHLGFSRLMTAYDTYVHTMQDPNDKYVSFKPELVGAFNDAALLPVYEEAYGSALQEIERLKSQDYTSELVMLVKQLAYSIRQVKPEHKASARAMEFLKSKGLISISDCLRGQEATHG